MANITDSLIVILSDMHSGSTKALFPNRIMQFENGGNHQPNDDQIEIWKHFEKCANAVKEARKKKRVILVHDGDALEGSPYNSTQFISRNLDDQVTIHIELMDWFMQQIDFEKKRGDLLYYVKGTEVHTESKEHLIGQDLGAEQNAQGYHAFDKLEVTINGKLHWFLHHGPGKGKGANAGNPLWNWLKHIYYSSIRDGIQIPDMVVSGHTHNPDYNVYTQQWGDGGGDGYGVHQVHGLICPSFQKKTRYAYKVAPTEVNKIGIAFMKLQQREIFTSRAFW